LIFISALGKANGAIQEAAVGAVFAVPIIAGYVVCRRVDAILDCAAPRR
jgi:hypothetical protein